MNVTILKQQIKTALKAADSASQSLDNPTDIEALQEDAADKISKAVQEYLKTSLTAVIGGGIAVPQDGGTSLKTTMQAQISSI